MDAPPRWTTGRAAAAPTDGAAPPVRTAPTGLAHFNLGITFEAIREIGGAWINGNKRAGNLWPSAGARRQFPRVPSFSAVSADSQRGRLAVMDITAGANKRMDGTVLPAGPFYLLLAASVQSHQGPLKTPRHLQWAIGSSCWHGYGRLEEASHRALRRLPPCGIGPIR
jgi:hypothetical protein